MRNSRSIAVRRELTGNIAGGFMLLGAVIALVGVLGGDNLSVLHCGTLSLGGTVVFWKAFHAYLNR